MRGISLAPLNWSVPTRIGNRTVSKQDADNVSESKQDTDDVTEEFFPARTSTTGVRFSQGDFLFSTGVELKEETSLDEFTLPLYRRRNDRR
jgi:hypothetical protein